jgi:RND family efflux transporter MFP subunit
MKKLFSTIIVLSALGLLLPGCGKKEETNEKGKLTVSDTIAVQTAAIEKITLKISKNFSGNLEGEEQANIVSKIPERIVTLKVKVGNVVKAGETLVVLDKSGASSQYYQAEAGFLNTGKDFNRMKALFKEGAISQQMLDGVETQYNIAKANFDAAKSTVELTTPISGVVTSVNGNIGDLATPGIPIITVASIGRMKIIFNAGEVDIPSLAVGQSVDVYSEIRPSLVLKGRIFQLSNSAEVSSRSFEIQALFQNSGDRWFKPGMFAKAKLELSSSKGSLVINNSSIVIKGEEKGVYVIENSKARYQIVELGITDGNKTEVLNGLNASDIVVTVGANNLKNGSPIHVSNN